MSILSKVDIVREGEVTFNLRTREEIRHSSLDNAKEHVSNTCNPADPKTGKRSRDGGTGRCITGKGVIRQAREYLKLLDEQEALRKKLLREAAQLASGKEPASA